MTDDRWTGAALYDDALVVELLLRLKRSPWEPLPAVATRLPSPPQQSQHQSLLPLPFGWGHRQPRSKPATTTPPTAITATCFKKEREVTRCSPTTPLSWSGTSTSDGYDESSRPSDRSSGGRSKAVFLTECATTATANTKSRKRKTFTELKEEEGFLLKERTHLKKELLSMQVTYEEQIARSANLKRLKHGLQLQPGSNIEERSDIPATTISYRSDIPATTVSYTCNQMESSSFVFNQPDSVLPSRSVQNNQAPVESCEVEGDIETHDRGFVLPDLNIIPDLNMTPAEE